MRAYQITDYTGVDSLACVEVPDGEPGPGEIKVNIKASSINYRDLVTIEDPGARNLLLPFVPNSDGAGEIVGLGSGVKGLEIGQRVVGCFFQDWLDGPISPAVMESALGGSISGVLKEDMIFNKNGVVEIPSNLSYAEAATLPCAALTAWHALVEQGRVNAGDTVLLLGTGGVSLFALQFAVMHGARPIITSSSNEKLERARQLGASHTINYIDNPEWHEEVLSFTGGEGVDHVVEVGGAGTLAQSIESTRVGGHIYLIGILAKGELNPTSLMRKSLHLHGIYVGSRAMFERMNKAVQATNLKPVVDQIFSFVDAQDAYRTMRSKKHFGKLVINVGH